MRKSGYFINLTIFGVTEMIQWKLIQGKAVNITFRQESCISQKAPQSWFWISKGDGS